MIDEKHKLISEEAEAFEKRLNELPQNISDIWKKIIGYVRINYEMDEIWNRETLRFRKSGKSLFSVSLKSDVVSACVIFGKKEREIFETVRDDFSEKICQKYDESKTYHDGKWIFFDIENIEFADEIIKLINIKKKPNRKLSAEECSVSPCGFACGLCSLYEGNKDKWENRDELVYSFAKCFMGDQDMRETFCPGCKMNGAKGFHGGNCKSYLCTDGKKLESCESCGELISCAKIPNLNPGAYLPGLTSFEVKHFALPYVNHLLLKINTGK